MTAAPELPRPRPKGISLRTWMRTPRGKDFMSLTRITYSATRVMRFWYGLRGASAAPWPLYVSTGSLCGASASIVTSRKR